MMFKVYKLMTYDESGKNGELILAYRSNQCAMVALKGCREMAPGEKFGIEETHLGEMAKLFLSTIWKSITRSRR
jgi:hypothetical protein